MRVTVPDDTLIEGVMILWARGMNTADMAKQWCCPESLVARALAMGRERKRAIMTAARADELRGGDKQEAEQI